MAFATKRIYTEDFELVKDEKDFFDIFTQTVSIVSNDVEKIVEVVKG